MSLSFVLIANPESPRVALFNEVLARRGLRPARVAPWLDLLRGEVRLESLVKPGDVVRLDSPGQNFAVERALLKLGACAPEEPGMLRMSPEALDAMAQDKGLMMPSRQWYLGWRSALEMVQSQLAGCREHVLMNAVEDVKTMYDKPACQEMLMQRGIAVPGVLGCVTSYEHLLALMAETRCPQVFLKPAHGSGGSGVVAFRRSGAKCAAMTTVEMVSGGEGVALYNNRKVRRIEDERTIAVLVNALAGHRLHAEVWVPKAGVRDGALDLRVLVIGGRAMHAVARVSRSPITNLHLLNKRAPVEEVVQRMGAEGYSRAIALAAKAAECFSGSLHAGVDLLIKRDWSGAAVLEVNAFGDLLKGVTHEGVGTYDAEMEVLLKGWEGRVNH